MLRHVIGRDDVSSRKHNSCLDILPSVKTHIQCLNVWQYIRNLAELSHPGITSVASLPPQRNSAPNFHGNQKTKKQKNPPPEMSKNAPRGRYHPPGEPQSLPVQQLVSPPLPPARVAERPFLLGLCSVGEDLPVSRCLKAPASERTGLSP